MKSESQDQINCVPRLLHKMSTIAHISLSFTDFILFRSNAIFIYFGAMCIFVQYAFESKTNTLAELGLCEQKDLDPLWTALGVLPFVIPLALSLILASYNELRLFKVGDNMTMQQQVVLDIFEKQNEGVVLI